MPQSTTNLGLPLFEAGDNAENWCKGINFAGNANSAFQKIDEFAATVALKGTEGTVTLLAANWSNNTYTLTMSGLGNNDKVDFGPSTAADQTNMSSAGLFVNPNPVNGVVTFTCSTTPAADISLAYYITRG